MVQGRKNAQKFYKRCVRYDIWILRKLIKINLFRLILTSSVASPETKYNIQQFRKHVLNEFL